MPQVQQNIEMLVKEVRRVYNNYCTCISFLDNGGQKYDVMDFSVLPQCLALTVLLVVL